MRGNETGNWTLPDPMALVRTELGGGGLADTELTLTGRAPGKTVLLWTSGRHLDPVGLEVAVLPVRRFRVAFRFVSVADGLISTQRPRSDVAGMFATARDLLRDQANVQLENGGSMELRFERSFGRVIDDARDPSSDAQRLSAHRDIACDVTVFFVKTFDLPGTAANEIGFSRANDNSYIIMEDANRNPARTLAHELVHNLGATGHSERAGDLMLSGASLHWRNGMLLNKDQILRINRGWR